jgi:hypothetical protein
MREVGRPSEVERAPTLRSEPRWPGTACSAEDCQRPPQAAEAVRPGCPVRGPAEGPNLRDVLGGFAPDVQHR